MSNKYTTRTVPSLFGVTQSDGRKIVFWEISNKKFFSVFTYYIIKYFGKAILLIVSNNTNTPRKTSK